MSNTQFVGQLFDQTYNYHQKSDLTSLEFPPDIQTAIQTKHPIFTLGLRYIPDNIKQAQIQTAQAILPEQVCDQLPGYVILGEFENSLSAQLNQHLFQLIYQNPNYKIYQTACP
jgi:hypothetical protein